MQRRDVPSSKVCGISQSKQLETEVMPQEVRTDWGNVWSFSLWGPSCHLENAHVGITFKFLTVYGLHLNSMSMFHKTEEACVTPCVSPALEKLAVSERG